jgi:hypothetical protein
VTEYKFFRTQFINVAPSGVATALVPKVREPISAFHLVGIKPECIERARFLINCQVFYEVRDGRDEETGARIPACQMDGHHLKSPVPALVIPLAFWPAVGVWTSHAQDARVEVWLNGDAPTHGGLELLTVVAV